MAEKQWKLIVVFVMFSTGVCVGVNTLPIYQYIVKQLCLIYMAGYPVCKYVPYMCGTTMLHLWWNNVSLNRERYA